MAQNRNKAAKRARSYSADAMLVRMVGGLLLIALGVMIFLAVVLSMAGDVFAGMRQICHGLAGGLAFLLPVLPIWGGVLVIVSIQRKPRLRPVALIFADSRPRHLQYRSHAHSYRAPAERVAAAGRDQHRIDIQRRCRADDRADIGRVGHILQHRDPFCIRANRFRRRQPRTAHGA